MKLHLFAEWIFHKAHENLETHVRTIQHVTSVHFVEWAPKAAHGNVLGSGIADPENEVIRVLSPDAVDSFDLFFFKRRLTEALRLRQALGLLSFGLR